MIFKEDRCPCPIQYQLIGVECQCNIRLVGCPIGQHFTIHQIWCVAHATINTGPHRCKYVVRWIPCRLVQCGVPWFQVVTGDATIKKCTDVRHNNSGRNFCPFLCVSHDFVDSLNDFSLQFFSFVFTWRRAIGRVVHGNGTIILDGMSKLTERLAHSSLILFLACVHWMRSCMCVYDYYYEWRYVKRDIHVTTDTTAMRVSSEHTTMFRWAVSSMRREQKREYKQICCLCVCVPFSLSSVLCRSSVVVFVERIVWNETLDATHLRPLIKTKVAFVC